MTRVSLLSLALLVGCTEGGTLATYAPADLDLRVTSPVYGSFTRDEPVLVEGTVGHPDATLFVEGERVPVYADGSFRVWVPYDAPYKVVDLEATLGELEPQTARVPVFAGEDPAVSWPGGLSARFTGSGLDAVAAVLAGLIDSLVTDELATSFLPPIQQNGFSFQILGLSRSPTEVTLDATDDGIYASIVLNDLALSLELGVDVLGFPITVPATLTLPRLGIGAPVAVDIGDEDGILRLDLGQPVIVFDDPEVVIAQAGFDWLTDLLLGQVDLEQLLTDAIGGALQDLDALELGGPFAFETDLLGTTLDLRLTELTTDSAGIGLGIALGIDAPAPDGVGTPVPLPTGDFGGEPTDLAVVVHDFLLQPLLSSELLALLDQELTLPGFSGFIFDGLLGGLPGGDAIPDNDGWCLKLTPGDARLARFRTYEDALVRVWLPDARLVFSTIPPGGGECTPWLDASLVLDVGLTITEGTQIGFDIAAPEGLLNTYGGVGYDEEEVIARLGGVLGGLTSLLGGFASIDLADLLGGLGGGDLGIPGLDGLALDLEIRGARPVQGRRGEVVDGAVELGVQLFGSRAP
jgi:hypothetical protein